MNLYVRNIHPLIPRKQMLSHISEACVLEVEGLSATERTQRKVFLDLAESTLFLMQMLPMVL